MFYGTSFPFVHEKKFKKRKRENILQHRGKIQKNKMFNIIKKIYSNVFFLTKSNIDLKKKKEKNLKQTKETNAY